jgi:hypothetical protein
MFISMASTLDPNWFYSSLAQCVAAIVGLLGAVLASKLSEQYKIVKESAHSLEIRNNNFDKTLSAQRSHIQRLWDHLAKKASRLKDAIKNNLSVIELDDNITFSSVSGHIGLHANDEVLNECNAMFTLAGTIKDHLHLVSDTRTKRSLAKVDAMIMGLRDIKDVHANNIATQFENHYREITAHVDKHNELASIRLPGFFSGVLIWLCAFGLVLPLAYLSAHQGVSKQFLLIIVSVGISAIPIFIVNEIVRIYRLRVK